MSGMSTSGGFDLSPWIAANAALASRLGVGRRHGLDLSPLGLVGIGSVRGEAGFSGQTITGDQDEERRRRLKSIAARPGRSSGTSGALTGARLGADPRMGTADQRAPFAETSTAALLASGYQPAVVKVISYAHGVTRATASAQYVERDEVELETHDGLRLADRQVVADEIKAWSAGFEKRSPSQDVVAVRMQLSRLQDRDEDRELLTAAVGAAFEGHRHAVRIEVQKDGILEARVIAVMARNATPEEKADARRAAEQCEKRPALPSRIRVSEARMGTTADAPPRKVLDARSEATMKARIVAVTGYPAHGVSLEPGMPGHGREALGQRLTTLVSKGPALDHQGRSIRSAEDIRDVTRDWGRHLRSQTPRDTMHMVVSAKAGTDVKDFTAAVRSFLHHQFSDHKFMFGVHTDKAEAGHIHAHVIVAVRRETGAKLHPGPADLAQWRVNYAAHAREHGLQVVATRAAEQASSRSYGPKDKSIVDVAEVPRPERSAHDRAYSTDPRNAALIANARQRMETARANPIRIPMTERERAGVRESLEHWQSVAKADPAHEIASAMVERLAVAKEAGDAISALKDALSAKATTQASHQSPPEKAPAPEMTDHSQKSADAMLQDLRLMNQRIADVSAMLPEGSREKFTQRAAGYLEEIAERVDQKRAQEAKAPVREKTQERAAAAPLVEQAQRVATVEVREAQQATRTLDRAVEAERKFEGEPLTAQGASAGITRQRAFVGEAERSASAEQHEAKAAQAAARSLARDPTQPIPASQVQCDPLAELRRQQAEMLERVAQERGRSKDRERGHEAGD